MVAPPHLEAAAAMNAMKDKQIEEWNKAHTLGGSYADVPAIATSRPLTWAEVETLTQGRFGTITSPCPFCGPDKPYSKRFRIRRPTGLTADWFCFYCAEQGSLTKEGPINPEEELKARQFAREL